MNVVKVKLLVSLLFVTLGTGGCATAQQITNASIDSTGALSNVEHTAMRLSPAGDPVRTNITVKPDSHATANQIAATTASQFAQTSYYRTVSPTSKSFATAPLTTLGSGEDLSGLVQHASGVVLLDFYADWCGPCRTQGGILHEMERTAMQNNASIIKVNIDQHRQLARSFNVTRLPTLILVKDGQIIERQTGIANHQKIASLLSR